MLKIRPVFIEDARAIVELLNPIIVDGRYTAMKETITVAEQIEFINSIDDLGIYNIATNEGGKVLGIQDILPTSARVESKDIIGEISTFVSLQFHRSGIGKQLSQVTFQCAKIIGYSKLIATVRLDNPGAISFYQSQGFIPVFIKNGQYRVLEKHLILNPVYI